MARWAAHLAVWKLGQIDGPGQINGVGEAVGTIFSLNRYG
jgi:hypothetical protein